MVSKDSIKKEEKLIFCEDMKDNISNNNNNNTKIIKDKISQNNNHLKIDKNIINGFSEKYNKHIIKKQSKNNLVKNNPNYDDYQKDIESSCNI